MKSAMQILISFLQERPRTDYDIIAKATELRDTVEKEQIEMAFDAIYEVYPDSSKGMGIGGQTMTPRYFNAEDYYNQTYQNNKTKEEENG